MHAHADDRARHRDASPRRVALLATLHCVAGCAVGEVLGLVVATALGLGNGASIALSVALAFAFGYGLSMLPLVRGGLPVRSAAGLALAADTLSIATMEAVDSLVVLVVPGAMAAGLGDPLFWGSLALALLVAFWAAYPVNGWLIARGRGHALVHARHG